MNKQIFAYTSPEMPHPNGYVKFIQAFDIGDGYKSIVIRNTDGNQNMIVIPDVEAIKLAAVLSESILK